MTRILQYFLLKDAILDYAQSHNFINLIGKCTTCRFNNTSKQICRVSSYYEQQKAIVKFCYNGELWEMSRAVKLDSI